MNEIKWSKNSVDVLFRYYIIIIILWVEEIGDAYSQDSKTKLLGHHGHCQQYIYMLDKFNVTSRTHKQISNEKFRGHIKLALRKNFLMYAGK